MRDTLLDRDYFNRYLGYQNKRIIKFEGLLEQLINEKGGSTSRFWTQKN